MTRKPHTGNMHCLYCSGFSVSNRLLLLHLERSCFLFAAVDFIFPTLVLHQLFCYHRLNFRTHFHSTPGADHAASSIWSACGFYVCLVGSLKYLLVGVCIGFVFCFCFSNSERKMCHCKSLL